jgi:hypothetical protein
MHVLVDIETHGLANDARVIQIGAVSFTLDRIEDAIEILDDRSRWLDVVVTPYESTTDESTIKAWQSAAFAPAVDLMAARLPRGIKKALEELADFCRINLTPADYIWARGTDFDIAILSSLYARYGQELPWKYNQARDTRTLLTLLYILGSAYRTTDMSQIGLVKHYAPHDAVVEAVTIQAALQGMRVGVLQSALAMGVDDAVQVSSRLPAEQIRDS